MPNVLAAVPETPTSLSTGDLVSELIKLVSETQGTLHATETQERFAAWRSRAAASVAASLRRNEQDPSYRDVVDMLSWLGSSGICDYAVPTRLVAEADAYAKRGWPGVVAGMLLVPSWQWANAPRLRDVPVWLTPLYAEYVFLVPALFTAPAQRAAVTSRLISGVSDLATLAQANRGSQALRGALERFRATEQAADRFFAHSIELRSARGRLLSALFRSPQAIEPLAVSREWRPLRIGVIAQQLVSGAALSVVSFLERLDSGRFEVIVFEAEPSGSDLVLHLAGHGASQTPLSGSPEDMAQTVKDAMLDVAVFVFDGVWSLNPVAPLCINRSAPLQIVHDGTGLPSMVPGADLYLSGSQDSSVEKSERRAVLPGLGIVNHCELSRNAQPDQWTREAMGIDEGTFVFLAAGLPGDFSAEAVDAWASLLSRVPSSKLVVCVPAPNGSVTDAFCARLTDVLSRRGIEQSRVSVISDACFASLETRKGCLAGTSVLLDLDGNDPTMVLAATELGIPTVTIGDSRDGRSGPAALLALAGATESIASGFDAVPDVAARLATSAAFMTQMGERLQAASARLVALSDSFVRSEAFGRILEKAFDSILVSRRDYERDRSAVTALVDAKVEALAEEFRTFMELGSAADAESRARAWVVMEPGSAAARGALAQALALRGNSADASAAWLTVVELEPQNATAWHELADTSLKAGRRPDAVQALEMAIRIDPKRVDSWLLLGTLARQSGDTSMQQDVLQILNELAPDDPRVAELAAAPSE